MVGTLGENGVDALRNQLTIYNNNFKDWLYVCKKKHPHRKAFTNNLLRDEMVINIY